MRTSALGAKEAHDAMYGVTYQLLVGFGFEQAVLVTGVLSILLHEWREYLFRRGSEVRDGHESFTMLRKQFRVKL